MSQAYFPGATIGVLGGGQLGRMMAYEALRMGYRIHAADSNPDAPVARVAEHFLCCPYDAVERLCEFARQVDVLTYELEGLPVTTVETIAQFRPVFPNARTLEITQNRRKEKHFLRDNGFPTVPFENIEDAQRLAQINPQSWTPSVVKSLSGYDGKGQWMLHQPSDWAQAQAEISRRLPAIVEQWVPLRCELSVIAARSHNGQLALYGPMQNHHRNHILDHSICPSPIDPEIQNRACQIASELAEMLDIHGLLCVEYFVTEADSLLVNELAPRPHNSGHLTIEASVTSQFEQHVRGICGLPLGDTRLQHPAAMANLLGEVWQNGEPAWPQVLAAPGVKLHLYGKKPISPKRKMGHLTALGQCADEALNQVLRAREGLVGKKLTEMGGVPHKSKEA